MAQQVARVDVWKADDDWSEIKERDQRKKRQNRLNQRAYRRRHAEQVHKPNGAFRVDRFRLVELPPSHLNVVEDCGGLQATDQSGVGKLPIPDRQVTNKGDLALELSLESYDNSLVVVGGTTTLIPPAYEEFVIDEGFRSFLDPLPTSPVIEQVVGQPLHLIHQSTPSLETLTNQSPSHGSLPVHQDVSTSYFNFPLSADHLLHLIQHNVLRALNENKLMISFATWSIKTGGGTPAALASIGPKDLCDGITVVAPKPGQILPPALIPTRVQMTIGHSSWLNMFPFPQLRDNLIRHQSLFDHSEFCADMFGESIMGRESTNLAGTLNASMDFTSLDGTDDLFSGRIGLIVWGEPWDSTAWELTPRFLNKWGFLLHGCEDLIRSSNRWRAERYETPLETSAQEDRCDEGHVEATVPLMSPAPKNIGTAQRWKETQEKLKEMVMRPAGMW